MEAKNELKLGMQPFWFWNGDMREEEIAWQIREMKQKGIPGFLIHPRQGMEVPYMSREYFERVKFAVRTAKENGLEVWLYDEYPYPSGICGGEVVLDHPEFLSKRLEKTVETIEGGREIKLSAPWGRVLLARAYRLGRQGSGVQGADSQRGDKIDLQDYIDLTDYVGTGYRQEVFQYSGLTQYNKKRYFTGDPVKLLDWHAPEGKWKIYLVTETVTKHFKYFENFIDTMNPEAVRYFIELTHERYKREIGEEFGVTVKGIFTDEITAFPDSQPWSPRLPEEVLRRHGIDLISFLPALWEELGDVSARVRYAYRSTAADCFIDAYDRQVSYWCRENGLLYIGEKPILRSRQLQYFDIPGIDTGHQKVGSAAKMISAKYRANGKMVSSAAHFYDKPAVLCEVGHSIGWGMTMQDLKWMFDWIGVQGVSFFVIHGFFYTTDGLKKHDAPPSAFYQMPWWEDAGVLTKYASELGSFLRTTKRRVKLLVMDPITSVWASNRETGAGLQEDFAKLQNQMLFHGLDYYIIDPELFAEGKVVCEGGNTEFMIHGERYEALVLPPMRNLEKEAAGKLLEFARKGGKVCGLFAVPFEEIQEGGEAGAFGEIFDVDAKGLWRSYSQGRCGDSERADIGGAGAKRREGSESGSLGAKRRERPEGGSLGEESQEAFVRPGTLGTTENCHLAGSIEDAVSWLTRQVNIDWEIRDEDGLGREGLPVLYGTGENGEERLFIVNTAGTERKLKIKDPMGGVWSVVLAEYESKILKCGSMKGGSHALVCSSEVSDYVLPVSAISSEITDDASPASDYASPASEDSSQILNCGLNSGDGRIQESAYFTMRMEDEMEFELSGSNAVRLGFWELTLPDGQRAVVETAPFIDQLEAGGFRYPVAQKKYFGCPKELDFRGTEAVYRTRIYCAGGVETQNPVYLVMEPGTFLGEWSLKINGKDMDEKMFSGRKCYMGTNLAAEAGKYLVPGENEITVRVKVDVSFGGMRNPLYIFGEFGVEKQEDEGRTAWRLAPLGHRGNPKDFCRAGLPFYYGEVVYTGELFAEEAELERAKAAEPEGTGEFVHVKLDAPWLMDSVRLAAGEYETPPCAWQPYIFRLPSDCLKVGKNVVKIKLRNTALGLFEGQRFDREKHVYKSV